MRNGSIAPWAIAVNSAASLATSAGVMAEWTWYRWRYYWNLRYQHPLTMSAESSQLSPKFAFDGSFGTAYYLTKTVKTGLFWYGQWQQFNFTSSDAAISNIGTESLFYSAIDLRLGLDF